MSPNNKSPTGGDTPDFYSPANLFLQSEVYRLGNEPGLRHLPPNPERDFLTLTWGPIVYRTTYVPESNQLMPLFLRGLNDQIREALPRDLPGNQKQMDMLERTYASKVFSDRDAYDNADERTIREAFRSWKISLALPSIELPARLRFCLVIDDASLSKLTTVRDDARLAEKEADVSSCPIKIIEENYPDAHRRSVNELLDYPGWTSIALSALVEVYDGLRQGKGLAEYHRQGRTYMGNSKWV